MTLRVHLRTICSNATPLATVSGKQFSKMLVTHLFHQARDRSAMAAKGFRYVIAAGSGTLVGDALLFPNVWFPATPKFYKISLTPHKDLHS